eukprot:jgi/Ulvmu1/11920/UM081_0080.1
MCVDWHAALVWRGLCQDGSFVSNTPWAFLNYRMFSRDDTAAEALCEAERWAVQSAPLTVTLSRADQQYATAAGWSRPPRPCPFLPPGIRADVAAIPLPADAHPEPQCAPSPDPGAGGVAARPLMACCVRLSPEKQPEHFVRAAAELSRRGALRRLALTPLLLAATTGTYADSIVAEFERTVPEGTVERGFKGRRSWRLCLRARG